MATIQTSNYPIYISSDISKDINSFLKKNSYSKLFILVDENSLKHCYPQLVTAIPAFEDAEIIEIESGEENKNIEVCTQLWAALSELYADRKSLLINIGGGVITDMGGFLASAYKRGIDFINIPTTLLAQVDASVGGKVGVDLNNIKNVIGFYNNPKAVFVEAVFLSTLDERQLKSGFAEIIKHALIADKKYWNKIKQVDFTDSQEVGTLIKSSIEIKNKIVEEDPFEKNIRKSLNFGHTVGHAIESFFLEKNDTAKSLLHGEAVAIGMICEAFISEQKNLLSKSELEEIAKLIKLIYKPVLILSNDFDSLIQLMQHDKKNEQHQINFTLLSAIGKCEINQTASNDQLIKALAYYSTLK